MEGTDQPGPESEGPNAQTTHETASHFSQNVPQYTQATSVPNGNDVGIANVQQTIETSQDAHDAPMSEDVNQAGLNIANVQVAVGSVAVSTADGVSIVDGSERGDDGQAHGSSMVTSLPTEYSLASHLAQQYVMQGSPTDGMLFILIRWA